LLSNRQKLFAVKPAQRPLIFGHRGSPLAAQENTLASFELAFAEGADGVEFDVRMTADYIPAIFHDDALPGSELLRKYSYADISARAKLQGLSLFTLEHVLAHLSGRGYLDIEIKDADLPPRVVPMVAKMLPADSYVYSSFLPEVIAQFSALAPDVPTIWIVEKIDNPDTALRILNDIGAAGFALWHELIDKRLAEYFAQQRVPLFTFTVNDPAQARRLGELGLVGIITDQPGAVRKGMRDKG
jgi:glycerophosphoryl diester phosphodiesterase